MGSAWKSDLGVVLGFFLLSSTFLPCVMYGSPASAFFSGETDCGGSSCGSSGSSGCGNSGTNCGSSGSCASTGSSSCGSPLSSRGSTGSSLGSSPSVVSSGGYGRGRASGCGSQTSNLAGGCQPGADSGCSGAATGCGPPSLISVANDRASALDSPFSAFAGINSGEDSVFSSVGPGLFRGSEIASIDLRLSASQKRLVAGDIVGITLAVSSTDDYHDATTTIVLPEGLAMVSQDSSWKGEYAKGQERVFELQTKATKKGLWKVAAKIECFDAAGTAVNVESFLSLSVGEEFWGSELDRYVGSTEVVEFSSSSIEEYVPLSPGTVTKIYGRWGTRECRCDATDDDDCWCGGDNDGRDCTGSNCPTSHYHYIPYAKIELWDDDADPNPDDLLTTAYTDTSGYFEFNNIDNVDEEGGGQEFYILYWNIIRKGCISCNPCGWDTGGSCTCGCYTIEHVEPDPDGGSDNDVPDISRSFRYTLEIGNLADGSSYDGLSRAPADSRASHICFAVMKAYEYMLSRAYGFTMPHVSIFYGSATSATIINEYEIYIYNNVVGQTGYDHGMDDDVVIHEYGHDIMWYFYGAWPRKITSVSPSGVCQSSGEGCSGGCTGCYNHGGSLNDCSCDAVTEGWANFIGGVVPEEWSPETGFTRDWPRDRMVVTKDKLVTRDLEAGTDTGTADPDNDTHPFDEMCFAALLWDIIDPDDDGESMQQPFEKGATWNDYAQNPVWFEMSGQNAGNDRGDIVEPYTNGELWWFYTYRFLAQKPQLCDVFAGASRASLTGYCDWKNCIGYCSGACDACVPNCADDPCGGAGCPGVGCVKLYCTTGRCDSTQLGQGCNGAWPSQCDCWSYGLTSICSNANPSTTCVSGCWKNPCECFGVGCPATGCYTCTGTVIDWCNCGGDSCMCGGESDCTAYAINNFMPCGGTVVDTCDCGDVSCACGSENDCAAFAVNDFMPCGGVTPCVCGGVGCACVDYCPIQPPSPVRWILLATDPDEGVGPGLKEIAGQRYSGVIYFQVKHYRPRTSITDIDTAILVDSDQNPSTGLPDGTYPGQTTGIGADYIIIVGWEGTEMWRWVGSWWDLANPIPLAYLDAPDGSNVFVVGVSVADVVNVGALDCAVREPLGNDWMPNTGHFTLEIPAWTPCYGTVVDTCDCGILLCPCGFENDCALYAANNFWPCGLTAVHDVAVIAVTPSNTIVGQGYPLLIDVTVENQGNGPARFNVTVYYGDSAITSEQWESFWSMGDVNRDGYINGTDLNLITAAYGATPSSPRWNPWADLDQNLMVDAFDLTICAYFQGLEIWTYAISGGVIGTLPVINLAAEDTQELTFTWDTSGVPYGNYVIGAYAVPILGKEEDRADNTFADGTILVTVPADDIAVVEVTPSRTSVGRGYPLLIDVTVENHGTFTESFNLTVYYSNSAITPEQWETFWSMGDVNRDGYINGTDVNLIIAAYGTTPGSSNWNPWADLNQDLVVDLDDVMLLNLNYGLEIWTYAITGGVIGTLPVIDLAAGNTRELTFTWDTSSIPYGNYVIGAYAVPILGTEPPLGREVDRADNTLADGTIFVTVPGDITGPENPVGSGLYPPDGTVDTYDLSYLREKYGTNDPLADFTGPLDMPDGIVDAYDLTALGKNFGRNIYTASSSMAVPEVHSPGGLCTNPPSYVNETALAVGMSISNCLRTNTSKTVSARRRNPKRPGKRVFCLSE